MGFIAIAGIAVGLSMDALAVSISIGTLMKNDRVGHAVKSGVFFGVSHALMLTLGWTAGASSKSYIPGFDHWVAFALLTFVGGKMIYESRKKNSGRYYHLRLPTLLLLSIAVSLDALAVGLGFSFVEINILLPAVMTGTVTFLCSFTGMMLGKKLGTFGKNAETLGGLIILLIGFSILIDHVYLKG